MNPASWLDQLDAAHQEQAASSGSSEAHGEALIALSLAAGREVVVPEDELRGAVRRALLVLAAGGDPNRGLELDGRAVETVAADLDNPFRRSALSAGLDELRDQLGGRAALVELIDALRFDGELAWRAFSAARMVQRLSDDELADD